MIKNKNYISRRAFSMVEVIVAAILFAAAAAGIFSTISYVDRTVDSDSRTKAALFSKKILDDLNNEVNRDTWDTVTSGLSLTTTVPHTVTGTGDFNGCTATYHVSDVDGARKVDINADCP